MSILTTRSSQTVAPNPWAGLVHGIAALPLTLMNAWHRRATIRALRQLDDRTLRDIGLRRTDLEDALRDTSSLDLWLQV